jgi:flagellar hook-length control protein FliK
VCFIPVRHQALAVLTARLTGNATVALAALSEAQFTSAATPAFILATQPNLTQDASLQVTSRCRQRTLPYR